MPRCLEHGRARAAAQQLWLTAVAIMALTARSLPVYLQVWRPEWTIGVAKADPMDVPGTRSAPKDPACCFAC